MYIKPNSVGIECQTSKKDNRQILQEHFNLLYVIKCYKMQQKIPDILCFIGPLEKMTKSFPRYLA